MAFMRFPHACIHAYSYTRTFLPFHIICHVPFIISSAIALEERWPCKIRLLRARPTPKGKRIHSIARERIL